MNYNVVRKCLLKLVTPFTACCSYILATFLWYLKDCHELKYFFVKIRRICCSLRHVPSVLLFMMKGMVASSRCGYITVLFIPHKCQKRLPSVVTVQTHVRENAIFGFFKPWTPNVVFQVITHVRDETSQIRHILAFHNNIKWCRISIIFSWGFIQTNNIKHVNIDNTFYIDIYINLVIA